MYHSTDRVFQYVANNICIVLTAMKAKCCYNGYSIMAGTLNINLVHSIRTNAYTVYPLFSTHQNCQCSFKVSSCLCISLNDLIVIQ